MTHREYADRIYAQEHEDWADLQEELKSMRYERKVESELCDCGARDWKAIDSCHRQCRKCKHKQSALAF